MSKWMSPETALSRVIENADAPVMARVNALRQLPHPSLNMLQRLIAQTAERKANPIPAKLAALATLKYAEEIRARKARRLLREAEAASPLTSTNALGI
jgi:hypothetical protein